MVKQKIVPNTIRAARRRHRVPLPGQPVADYIKRVVGVAGDEVEYRDKQLDGQRQAGARRSPDGSYYDEGLRFETTERRDRAWRAARRAIAIAVDPQAPPVIPGSVRPFPYARIATTMPRASPARCRRATTS